MEAVWLILALVGGCLATPSAPRRHERPDLKIAGGSEVSIRRVPYQVSVEKYSTHICGGSILSDSWVLTAAQCVFEPNEGQFQVRAGTALREEGGTTYAVKQILTHLNYNSETKSYDAGLIQITGAFTFSTDIQAVSLVPLRASPKGGQKFLVSGWGKLSLGEFFLARNLNALIVELVAHALCRVVYADLGQQVDGSMICAESPRVPAGVCQGDVGGPLVDDQGRLAGLVSWGRACGFPNYPYVYANLAERELNEWITDNAGIE